ncbi:hypothetical protein SAMN03159453_05637 [Pseudomonas sp. NFIX28]|nr:hypothetical protein SAMN03159453_05637 [Pseudomonas sp. NFIX28]
MNLPRPTRTTLALSLCLLALAGTLGYEHYQLSKLTSGLAATADKESLDALLTQLTQVDERLDTAWMLFRLNRPGFRRHLFALN